MAKAKRTKTHKPSSHPYHKITHPSSKPKASKPKSKPSQSQPTRPTIPFSPSDRILLVGEGDFSFAHSLLIHHACTSLTATSYDALPVLREKYPQAASHIQDLEAAEQTVLHGIDATKLGHPTAGGGKKLRRAGGFDRVIFNFPHTGGLTKDVNRQVRANQELLVNFFKSAIPLLRSSGSTPNNDTEEESEAGSPTIVVTLFTGQPYELWNVRDLARHVGLVVQRSFRFDWGVYPGYEHRRTLGNVEGGGGWKGEERSARTFIFEVPETEDWRTIREKKLKAREDEDEEDD